MRRSALVARHDERGDEVLVVHRSITFTLEQTARAMHAVVDSHMSQIGSRRRVGRARVRDVLRHIATHGWPADFRADPERVAFWRGWLLAHAVFTDDSKR